MLLPRCLQSKFSISTTRCALTSENAVVSFAGTFRTQTTYNLHSPIAAMLEPMTTRIFLRTNTSVRYCA